MTIQEMLRKKQELGLTYEEISKRSNVPVPTIKRVLKGTTKAPRIDTILALEKAFRPAHMQNPISYMDAMPESSTLHETPADYGVSLNYQRDSAAIDIYSQEKEHTSYPLLPYKKQGEYTEEDRDKLPDECRTELIDGVLYDMASPSYVHQIISGEIYFQLRSQIEKCGQDCLIFTAPSDVKISYDGRNILQPDLYIICDIEMIKNGKQTVGPPPFIIEILSPSTRGRDMLLKSYKYAVSGVKEYWIVDPEQRAVTVRDYEIDPQGTEYGSYTFNDIVPVAISGGHCIVDFSSIRDLLNRFGV